MQSSMPGFIVIGAVLLLIWGSVLFLRRFRARVRQSGMQAIATIVRMEGGASGVASAREYGLTLQWVSPAGTPQTQTVQQACATANMPQQGDKVRIFYLPDHPELLTFASDKPLRRDELLDTRATNL